MNELAYMLVQIENGLKTCLDLVLQATGNRYPPVDRGFGTALGHPVNEEIKWHELKLHTDLHVFTNGWSRV